MVAEPALIAPKKWTYAELSHDEEHPVECYDGELFDMTSPLIQHQRIVRRLTTAIDNWSAANGGEVFAGPVDLLVAENRFFVPDLCFYSAGRAGEKIEREDGRCLIAPPDLIIEVVSPSTARNDRVRKMRLYAEFGVTNYWIVEPDRGTLEAFALRDGGYAVADAFTDEDNLRSPLFPGLDLPLKDIFA